MQCVSAGCLVAVVVCSSRLSAQSPQRRYLTGRVTDSLSNPIAFANIQLNGASRVVAGDSGTFRLDVPTTGRFIVDVRRIGYQPLHFDFASVPDTAVRLAMTPVARMLAPMQVNGERISSLENHGFYDRLKQSQQGTLTGYFITPEDIERRQPSRASQMIEDVPSIRVRMLVMKGHPTSYVAFGSDGCLATTYVNGIRLNMVNKQPTEEMISAIFDDIAEPSALAGIEVYTRGTRAPSKYQGLNGSCAVVLIWTK